MDELTTVIGALISAQSATAFAQLSELRRTRALVWFAIGLFALVNNWPVVGIPAFVLTSVNIYRSHIAHCNAEHMLRSCKDSVR